MRIILFTHTRDNGNIAKTPKLLMHVQRVPSNNSKLWKSLVHTRARALTWNRIRASSATAGLDVVEGQYVDDDRQRGQARPLHKVDKVKHSAGPPSARFGFVVSLLAANCVDKLASRYPCTRPTHVFFSRLHNTHTHANTHTITVRKNTELFRQPFANRAPFQTVRSHQHSRNSKRARPQGVSELISRRLINRRRQSVLPVWWWWWCNNVAIPIYTVPYVKIRSVLFRDDDDEKECPRLWLWWVAMLRRMRRVSVCWNEYHELYWYIRNYAHVCGSLTVDRTRDQIIWAVTQMFVIFLYMPIIIFFRISFVYIFNNIFNAWIIM